MCSVRVKQELYLVAGGGGARQLEYSMPSHVLDYSTWPSTGEAGSKGAQSLNHLLSQLANSVQSTYLLYYYHDTFSQLLNLLLFLTFEQHC